MCGITNGFSGHGGTFEDDVETDCQTKILPNNNASPELGVPRGSAVQFSVNNPG